MKRWAPIAFKAHLLASYVTLVPVILWVEYVRQENHFGSHAGRALAMALSPLAPPFVALAAFVADQPLGRGIGGWLATYVAVLPLAAWVFYYRSRHAGGAGRVLCRRCGYDLRSSPYRCPECNVPNVVAQQERWNAEVAEALGRVAD